MGGEARHRQHGKKEVETTLGRDQKTSLTVPFVLELMAVAGGTTPSPVVSLVVPLR